MKNRPVDIFAGVPPGLEALCSRELKQLGIAAPRCVPGGVEFVGSLRELYLANLWLRSANRLLVRIGTFRSRDFPHLFRSCRNLPWGRFVRPGQALEVRVTSRRSRLLHSDRIAEVVREAVGRALGDPPEVPGLPPALLVVQLLDDCCRISVDSSGERLHRRGYRRRSVAAPLRENLAGALLLASGWDGHLPLCDPFCGSGTLPIEAALLAANLPPGRNRRFAFMDWPGYRPGLWQLLRDEAERSRSTPVPALTGRDLDADALAAARENAAAAGVAALIDWQPGDVLEIPPPAGSGLLIGNPPYGGRLGNADELPAWYAQLGRQLAGPWSAWRLALLVPDPDLVAGWPRPLETRLKFKNGGLDVWLVCSR